VDADGKPEQAFGRGGMTVVNFPATARPFAMAKLPSGRLVIVGGVGEPDATDIAVARLMRSGQLDAPAGVGTARAELLITAAHTTRSSPRRS
jgi:hypothetical protein